MQYFSQIGNLLYGNLLTWICNKLNIVIPRVILINPKENVPNHDLDDDDAVDFDYTTGTTDQVLRAMVRRQTRDLTALHDGQQELRIRQDENESRLTDFIQRHN